MSLKFDYNAFSNVFLEEFQIRLEQVVIDSWEQDVLKETSKYLTEYNDPYIGQPLASAYARIRGRDIVMYFEANPEVLVSAFGTGSLMDDLNNPLFETYWRSSNVNPVRMTKTIVGRKKGSYTDIFGNKRTSSGTMEGLNVEWHTYKDKITGEEKTIKPMAPQEAIQKMILLADAHLENHINAAIELAIMNIDISDYIIEREDK